MSTQAVSGTAAPPGRGWAVALTAIVGAEFMLQLDGTVVNVALPSLQSDLGLPVTAASWVPNGFLLAFGGLLLLAGRLGDVLGHRRVFLGGIALVVAASLVAGLAQNLETLILGRVLQGAGAALALPATLVMVINKRTDKQKSLGNLVFILTGTVASALGPTLGGLIIDETAGPMPSSPMPATGASSRGRPAFHMPSGTPTPAPVRSPRPRMPRLISTRFAARSVTLKSRRRRDIPAAR